MQRKSDADELVVSIPGRILWLLGVVRYYQAYQVLKPLCRVWHPLYWVLFFGLMPVAAFVGEPLLEILPFKMEDGFTRATALWRNPFTTTSRVLYDAIKSGEYKDPVRS